MGSIDNKVKQRNKDWNVEIAFNGIISLIKNEDQRIRNSYIWIERIKDFFQEMINTAESVKKGESCSRNKIDKFGQVMEFAGYYYGNKSINVREKIVMGAVEEFKGYIKSLNILNQTPEIFYWENQTEKTNLLRICERISCYFNETDS
jgi:hypothetical protein